MKVIIMRGIPGSGKSTWIKNHGPNTAVVVSADHYFIDGNGEYKFDPSKIGLAHQECFRRFMVAIRQGVDVVVDNTNTSVWEYTPYYLAAEAFGYEVELVWVTCPVVDAAARNVHGVPEKSIRAMSDRFEDALPWHNQRLV